MTIPARCSSPRENLCTLHRPRPLRCWATVAATLTLGALALVGCSKEKDGAGTAAGKSVSFSKTLLDAVPASAVVVGTWDLSSAGFEKFKASRYGAVSSTLWQGPLTSLPGQPAAALEPLMKEAKDAGLFPAMDPAKPEKLRGYVGFITLNPATQPGQPPQLGGALYFQATQGVNLAEHLGPLGAAFEKSGHTVARSSRDGLSILTVTLKADATEDAAKSPLLSTVHVLATTEKLAIASSEGLAQRFFNTALTDSFSTSPQYIAAAPFLPTNESNSLGMSFIDLKSVATIAADAAPEAEREQVRAGVQELPIERVVGYLEMEDAPVLRYAAPFNAKTEAQQKLVAALQSAKAPEVFSSSPAESILAVSLDGAALRQLKQAGLASLQGGESQKLQEQIALLDSVSGLGIGVANSSGASPFPEIFLLGSTTNATAVAKALKEVAAEMTNSSGMPTTPWQQKSVAGVPVEYMLSPIGVGIFVGSVGQTVFMATSETMSGAIVNASTKSGPSLGSTIKDFSAQAVVASHLNFGRLYDLLVSLQGTLAMFGGGQGFDTSTLTPLKELGSMSAVMSLDPSAVRVVARMQPVSVK